MRLHHLIEQLQENIIQAKKKPENSELRNVVTKKSKDVILHINDKINEYVQIDIGRLYHDLPEKEVIELQEYSIDMLKNGLNIFPYDNIVLSLFQEREAIIIIEKDEKQFDAFFTMKANYFDTDFPVAQCFVNSFVFTGILEGSDNFQIKSHVLFNLKTEKDEQLQIDDTAKRIGNCCLQIILAVCAIMNSNNTEITTTPAPKRLNEKRIKKGKPPIGEIKEIRINYGGKRYMIDGSEEGGTHASPRLHWRRGHVRRLPTGKITNVRPTLVGEIKGEEPKMPVYKITNAKEHKNDI